MIMEKRLSLYYYMSKAEFKRAKVTAQTFEKDEYYSPGTVICFDGRYYIKTTCQYETNWLLGIGWKEIKVEN